MKSAILRPRIVITFLIMCAVAVTVYASQPAAPAPFSQGSLEYRNDKLGFSLRYPAGMTVRESDEGYGAQSIAFDSETPGQAFYIMAIPYSQVDISAEGFQPHDAYGLADQGLQLRDVDIIRSSNVQIWFVKLGVIYEVAGAKGSEAWLTEILKTWQFD